MSQTPAHRYTVRVLPAQHELEVELVLAAGGKRALLQIPTWVPGAYAFMKYGRNVFSVEATQVSTGQPVALVREGWSGFRLGENTGDVEVRYRVVLSDPAWGELVGLVDDRYAVLPGTCYLFAPEVRGPVSVRFALPPGWRLHVPAGAEDRVEEHVFADHRAFLDTPIVLGNFERKTRQAKGTDFHFLFVEPGVGFAHGSEELITAVMKVVLETHTLFGGFPFAHYSFICSSAPTAHWGLEHASSTMIGIGPHAFIDPVARTKAIRLAAHELFHAWNVCRLKPAPLGNLDSIRGGFPDALWISEGLTRYYEFLLLVRTGELSPDAFFSNVVNFYRDLAWLPAYQRVALSDSSRATFLNHNQYPGSVNATIDYYGKGMLVSFDLDVLLRRQGKDASLDFAFKAFYERFLLSAQGFTTADFQTFVGNLLPGGAELITREVDGPGGLSCEERLAELGFEVKKAPRAALGIVLKENSRPEIANVVDDLPAGAAGLMPGDTILAVNGFDFDLKALKWLISHEPELTLTVQRGARHLEYRLRPDRRPEVAGIIWRGDRDQAALIERWLGLDRLAWEAGHEVPLSAHDNFHGIQAVL